MKNKLKFPDPEFLNRTEPQKEVKSAEEILKKHTGFTYPRTGEYNLSDILDAMHEYASQFQTEQRQVTDEEIEEALYKSLGKKPRKPVLNEDEFYYYKEGWYAANGWMRDKITKQCKE